MSESLLVTPSIPFAPAAPRGQGVVARTVKALAAPWKWLRNRQAHAELAALSEREWHDIGAGPRDFGVGYPRIEDPQEQILRKVAVGAWVAPQRKPFAPRARAA